jgi:hypothetical protein
MNRRRPVQVITAVTLVLMLSFPAAIAFGSLPLSLSVPSPTSAIARAPSITSAQAASPAKSASCSPSTIQLSPPSISGLNVTVAAAVDAASGSVPCSISSVTWSWGDGTASTSGTAVYHIYSTAGFYTITAKAVLSNGASATASEHVTVATPIMVNLITYDSVNGYLDLTKNINSINEITIFVAQFQKDGSISYDGNDLNVAAVIAFAHQHGVRVALAVGGSSEPVSIVNKVLNSPSLRTALINSVKAEVMSKGYDAVQWDIENQQPGDFNAANYVALIQQARQAMPGVEFDIVFAPWMTSIDVPALAPFSNYFLYGYPTTGDYNASGLAHYAKEAGGADKLMVGYDLEPSDPTYHVPNSTELSNDKKAGYGVFFFEASKMDNASYSVINSAFGTIGSPGITSVSPITSDTRQTITITGSNFGSDPAVTTLSDGSYDTLMCNQYTPALGIQDMGKGVDSWTASLSGCAGTDGIGIYIASWTNTQIVLGGFGTTLGNSTSQSPNFDIKAGDRLQVRVYGFNQEAVSTIRTVTVGSPK